MILFFSSLTKSSGRRSWTAKEYCEQREEGHAVSTARCRVISQRDRVGTKRNDVRRRRVRARPSKVVDSAEVRKKGREENRSAGEG